MLLAGAEDNLLEALSLAKYSALAAFAVSPQSPPIPPWASRFTDLIVDVRDVLHKLHVESEVVPHDPAQHVGGDIVSRVSEMPGVVDGRAATVPGHLLAARVDGHEGLLLAGERVVDLERGERDAGGRSGRAGPGRLFAAGG